MKHILFYVRKRLLSQKMLLLVSIAVTAVFFMMISDLFLSNKLLKYSRQQLKDCLTRDEEHTGVVSLSTERLFGLNLEESQELSDRLSQIPELDAIGNVSLGTMPEHMVTTKGDPNRIWKKIYKRQKELWIPIDGIEDGIVLTVSVNDEIFKLTNLSLVEGKTPSECEKDYIKIYLGYEYKNIPVGSVFTRNYAGLEIRYVVAGRFEKGASIISDMASDGSIMAINDYQKTFCLDKLILISGHHSFVYQSNVLVSCKEGVSLETVVEKINDVTSNYGIQAKYETLSHYLDKKDQSTEYRNEYFKKIFIALILGTMVVLLSTQLLVMFKRKTEIAVWLIGGMSRKTIFSVLVVENLIKNLLAYMVTLIVSFLWWGGRIERGYLLSIYSKVFIWWDLALLGCAIVISLVIACVPFFYFVKLSRADLIKGNWNEASSFGILGMHGDLFSNVLIVVSFCIAFGVLYYCLDFMRQRNETEQEQKKGYYEENYYTQAGGGLKEEVKGLEDMPTLTFEEGNFFVSVFTSDDENVMDRWSVEVLLYQNEDFLETIHYLDCGDYSGPKCIVGSGLMKEARKRDDGFYIKLAGFDCRIIGVFEPVTFPDRDKRTVVFGDSLSHDELEALLFGDEAIDKVRYRKAKHENEGELAKFLEYGNAIFVERFIRPSASNWEPYYVPYYGTEAQYQSEMSSFLKMIYMMMGLAVFDCILITSLWVEKRAFEMNLRRTLGYTESRLLLNLYGQLLRPEICAFLVVALVSVVWESLRGRFGIWCRNISMGALMTVAVSGGIGMLLALFAVRKTRKNPAEVLKCNE